ncbi:hypothetical protein VQL36_18225 [Chengkuizengella sp. SCS-71B]|uniref:hypothetical protein n=1 Tax=Chengkuizengella sp. SCS-71B TaxID=3115290 RepID=UPI0032C22B7C
MRTKISNLKWSINDKNIIWKYNNKPLIRKTTYPPKSVVELADRSGLAIVFSTEEYGVNNAFIINANGSERLRLKVPSDIRGVICFHEIYYIGDDLTAIIVANGCDFACVYDVNSGNIKKKYETR